MDLAFLTACDSNAWPWLPIADKAHVHTPIVLWEEGSASGSTLRIRKLRHEGSGQVVE